MRMTWLGGEKSDLHEVRWRRPRKRNERGQVAGSC